MFFPYSNCRSQWSSGWHVTAAREVPGSNSRCRVSVFFTENHGDTQIWARAAHLPQCLGRLSLPPSEGRQMSRPTIHCMVNTWRWVSVRHIAAYRRTQRSSLQLGLRVGGHLALTDFRIDDLSELSHIIIVYNMQYLV